MKIITLTLSPAFDIHCYSENFKPYHENLAHITEYDAGGKGVNISRALIYNEVPSTALVVLGEENGDTFAHALTTDGIEYRAVTLPGRIRENITLHTDGAPETRISFEGFVADDSLIDRVEKEVLALAEEKTVLTLTGRVPAGISMKRVKEFLAGMKARGILTVIDSRSFTLADLIEAKPFLIKPNEEEICAYTGENISNPDEARAAAERLHAKGIANVMISLGSRGALLACETGVYMAEAPKIEAKSTIGAGDSSIAGFLAALREGKTVAECLRTAVAYGSAACLTPGTRPPMKADVDRFLSNMK